MKNHLFILLFLIPYSFIAQESNKSNMDNMFDKIDNATKKKLDSAVSIEYYNKSMKIYNYQEKILMLDTAIMWSSRVSRYYLMRGVAKEMSKDNAAAIIDYTNAIRLDQNYVVAYSNRAYLYKKMANYNASIKDYDIILAMKDHQHGHNYKKRGEVKELNENFKGAIEDYNKAIKLDPEDGYLYYYRGTLKVRLGDFYGSLSDLNKALSKDENINPKDLWTIYYFKGLSLLFRKADGDLEEAIIAFNKSINYKETSKAFSMRAKCHLGLGNKIKACDDLSKSGELGNMSAYDEMKIHCR